MMRMLISPRKGATVKAISVDDLIERRRRRRKVFGISLVGLVLCGLALVSHADPPDGPPPGAKGVCCLGGGVVPAFQVTRDECLAISESAIWIQGNFKPTDDECPCDILPGGD